MIDLAWPCTPLQINSFFGIPQPLRRWAALPTVPMYLALESAHVPATSCSDGIRKIGLEAVDSNP